MAVKRISKISNIVLWVVAAISIVVFALFYLGGEAENSPWAGTQNSDPKYTETLIFWIYTMFALCIICLVGFGLFSFSTSMMEKPKSALAGLGAILAFVALLGITYSLGDTTPLEHINADSQVYNTPFWLKTTDMFIFSVYVMLTVCILSMIGGAVMKFFNK